jgi:putative oxidoreductase
VQPLFALAARLAMASIFFWSGFGKVLSHAQTVETMKNAGIPHSGILYFAVVVAEIGGSLMLALGARTRFAAFILAGYLIPVTYSFHFHFADPLQLVQFLKNLAIFGGLLQVVAFGAGRFSLDGR